MNAERWEKLKLTFTEALELDEVERGTYMQEICSEDKELFEELRSLLEAYTTAGLFDQPLEGLKASALSWLSNQQQPNTDDMPSNGSDPLLGRQISHYLIEEKLGTGGMGVVYKAKDTKLDRSVALKFLPPYLALDDQAKKRFLREARSASALDHPNIAAVHEIGETRRGRSFIALAYYNGETLQEKMARSPLPIEEAADYAFQIAGGLKEAHAAGITHRDIKPANVIITEEGVAKIIDFGVARLEGSTHMTSPGTRMGTVAYMSPEQTRGEAVDHRTDLWSLGVIIYEMLTGERPFRGDSEQAVIYAIQNKTPEPLTALCARVPGALEQITEKTLTKRPEERYATLQDLIVDLQNVRVAGRNSTQGTTASALARQQGTLLPEGERRQATIVVSNLVGYTDLVEQLAPEAVDRVMNRIRIYATEIAERHGGVINRCTDGDLVLLFGIPTTHEDDSLRAARAAVELHSRMHRLGDETASREIRLASGLDTGMIVAHRLKRGDQAYRIAGLPRQRAALLAARAETGEVLVSQDHRRLIAPFFKTEAREPLALRGRGKPVTPYRLIGESGLQSRLEATERASLTAYTGREKELDTLDRCLGQALQGDGQFVTVEGEAGLGKSRLLYEFRQRLDLEAVQLLQGRCQSHDSQVPYRPLIETLRDSLKRNEGDIEDLTPDRAVDQIRAVDPALEEFIPLYLHLLSIKSEAHPLPKHMEGEQLRLAMIEALSAVFTLNAKHRPVVMLLEDWHWSDEASKEVLRQLAEMISAYPLLVVANHRPAYELDWGRPARHTQVHLSPLEATSSVSVMASVVGTVQFPKALGRLLHARTGGNPFFLEEMCRTLLEEETLKVEDGQAVLTGSLQTFQLPDTIQAVLRTRLDRLGGAAREVLCVASVIGRDFTRRLLTRVLSGKMQRLEALDTLRALGLIQQTHVLPEVTYRFKHVLVQEVAFESLLQHQRKDVHLRVGQAIEALHPNLINEQPDVLAHHFSRAEDWEKAAGYGLKAARRAHRLSQFSEALSALESAEKWLLKLPDDSTRQNKRVEMLLEQERLCEIMGLRRRQQELIDELLALLEAACDRAGLAEVYLRQGDVYTLLRRFETAEEALDTSLQLSRARSDEVGERNALRSLGLLRWHQERNEEALERVREALAIDRKRGNTDGVAGDLSNLGNIFKGMGNYQEALTHLEEALELTRASHNPLKQGYVLHILANIYRALGNIDQAVAFFKEAIDVCTQHRLLVQQSFHLTSLAHTYLQQDDVAESLRLYEKAVALNRKVRHADGLAQSLRILGDLLLNLGRTDEALPYLNEAVQLFAQLEDHATEALMQSRIAAAHEQQNNKEALTAWSQARELRIRINDHAGELEALEGIARVTRRHIADPSAALQPYREAVALAELLEDKQAEGRLRNTVGILEWNQDHNEAALAQYEKALRLFQYLGDRIHEGLMLNSLGVTLKKLDRPRKAKARLEEAVHLHRQTEQRLLEGHALAALAAIYFDEGEMERAQDLYERSLNLRRAIDDQKGEGWMLYHLARTYAAQGEPTRTREYATQAEEIANKRGDDELVGACRRLRNE